MAINRSVTFAQRLEVCDTAPYRDSTDTPEIDYSGCPAIGVAGYHSKHYDPEEGGECQWCGMSPDEG
jgi:hypothetical protein